MEWTPERTRDVCVVLSFGLELHHLIHTLGVPFEDIMVVIQATGSPS